MCVCAYLSGGQEMLEALRDNELGTCTHVQRDLQEKMVEIMVATGCEGGRSYMAADDVCRPTMLLFDGFGIFPYAPGARVGDLTATIQFAWNSSGDLPLL